MAELPNEPEALALPSVLVQIHEFLAVPRMELDDAHYELYPVTNWAMALGLLSHLVFIPTFWALGVDWLALYNILSAICFVVALGLARSARLNASLLVGSGEVVAHAVIATALLGWHTGFHYHVILSLVLLVMFGIMEVRVRLSLAAGCAVTYALLALYAIVATPMYTLGPVIDRLLLLVNLAIFLTVLSGICLYYTWTVASNRDARDAALADLRDALERTRELDRMKTDFTSMVSHELRTPLTSILGFAKVSRSRLEDRILPLVPTEDRKVARAVRQVQENLGIIVSEGDRLTTLINDLLDIAKMEGGQMEYARVPVEPVEVVRRSEAACQGLFQDGDVELRVEVAEELPTIKGDQDRLIQVLVNLVSNAAKFTETGHVTVKAGPSEGGVCFEVEDTGAGISDADLQTVFEKFRQVGSLDDRPTGSGLGLAICRQIVEAHGGALRVESTLGEGSRFFFELPTTAP